MKFNISRLSFIPVLFAIMFSACSGGKTLSKQDKGIIIGSVGGAVAGSVVGSAIGKGNTAKGAIFGAVIGGVAGAIIGRKMDKQAEQIKKEIPGATVERVGEGINVTFDERNPDGSKMGVYFATNQSTITANSRIALEKLMKIFAQYPDTDILIEGHTDDVGTEAYNQSLSQRRAEAVGSYLRAQGLSSSRLKVKWYGETQPKYPNTTAENRSLNRRVEFVITANEKMKADAKKEADTQK